jgi:hypothetical protein
VLPLAVVRLARGQGHYLTVRDRADILARQKREHRRIVDEFRGVGDVLAPAELRAAVERGDVRADAAAIGVCDFAMLPPEFL